MMSIRGCVGLILGVICSLNAAAGAGRSTGFSNQSSTGAKEDSTVEEKPTHVTISAMGGSNLIENGKKAATQQYYVMPTISYSFESGIYANVSANYVGDASKQSLDNIGFGVGYSHTFGDHFSVDLGYTYEHYYTTEQVTSSAANSVSFATSWSGKVLTPSVGVSYAFGDTKDITTSFGLSHSFDFEGIFGKKDALSIPISATASAGTSSFYQEYAKKHPIKKKGGKNSVSPTEINTAYALNSVCFGVGITYTVSHFSITPAASYTVSTNDPSSIDVSKAPDITLAVSYSF
ncbi:hypothetical protein [uncultured Acetobacteroides sp.]|uniref:hypothetical protein n=1 Tax=uncultured Acetobacteroides sp. TaxID=1760811 RepID=UPI0029F4FAEF|nr:hypothetical protein [uncultured Acetobacteroides sp.]